MDIGGRYAGTVSGAMNMMGSIAGALSVARGRLPAGVDGAELDADVLHLGGDLHASARSAGCSWTRTRRWKEMPRALLLRSLSSARSRRQPNAVSSRC